MVQIPEFSSDCNMCQLFSMINNFLTAGNSMKLYTILRIIIATFKNSTILLESRYTVCGKKTMNCTNFVKLKAKTNSIVAFMIF